MKQSSGQLLDNHLGILKGRADVILAGMLILEEFMQLYDISELTASRGGVFVTGHWLRMKNEKRTPKRP
jgi:exopolyphosphatase/pppGpp-phosphohydrolase